MLMLTKVKKEKLLRQFKAVNDAKLERLVNDANDICNTIENQVTRKINAVSVTLWNVKIGDVLHVERTKSLDVRRLLHDIRRP